MRKPITVCLALALGLTLYVPTSGITHCHDYIYYVVTGNNWDNLSPEKLREVLTGMGYKRTSTTSPQTQNESGQLKRHDVVIFGDSHSGVVVDDQGHINHFLQDTKLMKQGRAYTVAEARSMTDSATNETLLRRGWTLRQIREFQRKLPKPDGTDFIQTPFKDVKMEIWRHPSAESLPKTNRFWD